MVKIKGRLGFTRSIPFYSESGNRIVKRIANKEHECNSCRRIIKKGEIETELTGNSRFYSGLYTIYFCSSCWRG